MRGQNENNASSNKHVSRTRTKSKLTIPKTGKHHWVIPDDLELNYVSQQQINSYFEELNKTADNYDIAGLVVGGSQSYGTAHENSDFDTRGLYRLSIDELLAYNTPHDVVENKNIDFSMYELKRFMVLCDKASPQTLEHLFAPAFYESDVFSVLKDNRRLFLSQRIYDSHRGFVAGQLKQANKFLEEGNIKRKEKVVKHCFRLLRQGQELLSEGEMNLKVPNKQELDELGKLSLEEAKEKILEQEKLLEQAKQKTKLPEKTDQNKINSLLIELRHM